MKYHKRDIDFFYDKFKNKNFCHFKWKHFVGTFALYYTIFYHDLAEKYLILFSQLRILEIGSFKKIKSYFIVARTRPVNHYNALVWHGKQYSNRIILRTLRIYERSALATRFYMITFSFSFTKQATCEVETTESKSAISLSYSLSICSIFALFFMGFCLIFTPDCDSVYPKRLLLYLWR